METFAYPKTRLPLREIEIWANRVKRHLEPYCERIEVAGSIRRREKTCGDIEIVCIPKWQMMPDENALFPVEKRVNLLESRLQTATFKAVLKSGPKYKQVILDNEIYLDIFITNAGDYGRQLAIRTGPSDYSKKLAGIWVKKGWCGTEDGLRRQDQCKKINGKWICQVREPILAPKFVSEISFFDFLGLAMWHPTIRK